MKSILLVVSIVCSVFLLSCNIIEKTEEIIEDTTDVSKVSETISEYSYALEQFNQLGLTSQSNIINAEEDTQTNTTTKATSSITIEPFNYTEFPKTITVDFGEGTTGDDGKVRTGKIIITLENGWINTIGYAYTTTFENYTQSGNQIEGTHTVYRLEDNGDMPVYSVTITNGIVTKTDGTKIYYSQETTRTHVVGWNTSLNLEDDAYEVEGNQYGTTSSGYEYTVTTNADTPIYYGPIGECAYIRSGILNLEVDSLDAILDYGDMSENCDDDLTVTIEVGEFQQEISQ